MLQDISKELHEYIRDTGFILVVLDSMSLPVLTKKSKHKIKELKNVEEHIFHPGGDSNHYCSMMTNVPKSYATYPLSQTSDRSKNRLAVFAVKLRESMKAYLSDKDDWPTSYYSELLLDTLLEDFTSAEIKDLDVWYGKHEMQEEVYTVSYKITTDDKFLQNMMRSVDALPARTEANLESVNGRSAEFFKTSVLYARRKLIPRLSFETSVIYRGTYGKKIPLSAMDDSCMILWWVKNKRPYQLFVTSSRDFMDVQRRTPASKISMVTFWSGRTSDVAQGGITMRDSATAGLGDQPPALPRTLEQIPLQELYRPVPEEVLPPVTPPPIPAEQPIEVDDEDMQPPDQPQQSMQPPLDTTTWWTSCPIARFSYAGFNTWLSGTATRSTTSLTTTSRCTSPGTRQSDDSLVCCSRNTSMDATSCRESQSATSALATASSADDCTAVDAAFMVATCLSRTTSSGRGNFSLRGNSIFRGNDASDYNTFTGTATTANAARAITGFSGGANFGQRRRGGYSRGPAVAASSPPTSRFPLLILESLLRHLLMLCLLCLLLRFLFRLGYLCPLLRHLLRVQLLQLPRRPGLPFSLAATEGLKKSSKAQIFFFLKLNFFPVFYRALKTPQLISELALPAFPPTQTRHYTIDQTEKKFGGLGGQRPEHVASVKPISL